MEVGARDKKHKVSLFPIVPPQASGIRP